MTRDWNHLRRRAAILQRLAARAFEVVSSAAAGRELQRSTSVFYLYRFRLSLDGNLSNGDVLTRQTLRGCPDVGLARDPLQDVRGGRGTRKRFDAVRRRAFAHKSTLPTRADTRFRFGKRVSECRW